MKIVEYANVLVKSDDGHYYRKHENEWYIVDNEFSFNINRVINKSKIDELDLHVEKCRQNLNKSHQSDKNYTNMNAKQAREIATRANTESEVIQYKKIKSLIDTEANKGNFELWYYEQIKQNTITILEGEGFHVTIASERQGDHSVKITW